MLINFRANRHIFDDTRHTLFQLYFVCRSKMFDTVVSKLVKSIGSDLYIPSASVASAQNICPLTLVERKASKWWLGSNTYSVTDFVLSDVVLDGDPLKVILRNL